MVTELVKRGAAFGAALLLAVACETTVTDTGGETNWLAPCDDDGDCKGGLSCNCGACTGGECLSDAGSGGADGGSGGACTPIPCPKSAPWSPAACRCVPFDVTPPEGGTGGAGGSGANEDGGCRPLPCPTGVPWNPRTCVCEEPGITTPDASDHPDPPPYCVAPCVWRAVKACLPAGGACLQGSRQGTDGEITTFCQPETGWKAELGALGSTPFGPVVIEIFNDAVRCFYVSDAQMPGANGGASYRMVGFNDVALQIDDAPVVCGSLESLIASGYATSEPHVIPEGLESYVLDRARPECAAWDEWGFPVSPCPQVTPGSCE